MTLRELINALEALNPTDVVTHGFTRPHSWRGSYDELAFEPAENVTVAAMLAEAKSAVGSTYTGYKGGEYTMDLYTDVHLARYGECGEPLTAAFFTATAYKTELADLRARVHQLEQELVAAKAEPTPIDHGCHTDCFAYSSTGGCTLREKDCPTGRALRMAQMTEARTKPSYDDFVRHMAEQVGASLGIARDMIFEDPASRDTLSITPTAKEAAFKLCGQIALCERCRIDCDLGVGSWDREPVGCWLYQVIAQCRREHEAHAEQCRAEGRAMTVNGAAARGALHDIIDNVTTTTPTTCPPPVHEIVKAYLNAHGYDGLYSPGECACTVDDLIPCGNMGAACLPGYLTPCDCGEHDYHIGPHRATEDATATLCPHCHADITGRFKLYGPCPDCGGQRLFCRQEMPQTCISDPDHERMIDPTYCPTCGKLWEECEGHNHG